MINAYRRWRHQRRQEDAAAILWVLHGGCPNFSYEIGRAAGVRSGRLYPALTRLEQAGLVHAGWEDKPVHPRRWYQLTAAGLVQVGAQRG